MNPVRDEGIEEAIALRATEWFVRHRENPLTSDERDEYLEWLRASPRHVRAYLNLIALTGKLPRAVAGLGIDTEALALQVSQAPLEAQSALFSPRGAPTLPSNSPSRLRSPRFAVAATILLGIVVGAVWAAHRWLSPPTFSTPAGQQRVMVLADGSTVHLNSNTRIIVRFTGTQRLIELPDGQALFSVTHDARRPFIVHADTTDVVAIGTQFDVLHRAGQTQVTVVEGQIEIIPDKPDATAEVRNAVRTPFRLGAGEQATLANGVRVASSTRADVRSATAWIHKEVGFSAERIEDIARQFNRHTGVNISIQDPRLRDYRISGVFQAYDLDSFLQYFRQFDGITIERHGQDVRVLGVLSDSKEGSTEIR